MTSLRQRLRERRSEHARVQSEARLVIAEMCIQSVIDIHCQSDSGQPLWEWVNEHPLLATIDPWIKDKIGDAEVMSFAFAQYQHGNHLTAHWDARQLAEMIYAILQRLARERNEPELARMVAVETGDRKLKLRWNG